MYRLQIIEDDQKAQAELWDMTVHCVQNFREAMSEFAAFDPPIILPDIGLPFFQRRSKLTCHCENRKLSKLEKRYKLEPVYFAGIFYSTAGLSLLTKPAVCVFSMRQQLYCLRKEADYEPNQNRKIYCRMQKTEEINTNAVGREAGYHR